MISIYIDADACPVKQEIYRVAERHARKGTALKVFVVSNSPITPPPHLKRDDSIFQNFKWGPSIGTCYLCSSVSTARIVGK